jgi:hypothetical protein
MLSSCQAVGIRLEKRKDFPFYVQVGFPDFFVLKEDSLLVRDENDQLVYEKDGSTFLDCMCGNIIKSHFNPAFTFFTKNGSFWTNSTTSLLSSFTEEQKEFVGHTRNICNYSGYESIALIPLKDKEKTIGLIHLADPRESMFTAEQIAELELVAKVSTLIIKHANEIIEGLSSIDSQFLAVKE